ncbi:TRAP transporter small permease subunit [Palleronia sp.]|uniref:TRAP transporter small permease subunit n=1 Tax=Palleronia sp. TaxID=1940284 RepID=UPI0035C86761
MIDLIVWIVTNLVMAPWNLLRALAQPGAWLDWSNGESLVRFIYYGGSSELFFVVFAVFLAFTGVGLWRTGLLWRAVRVLEAFANTVGRIFAWAGLLMVLQQIVIVFAQRVFASSQLGFGFGTTFTFDVSWWSEELRLYNAMLVALCCAYTYVQQGHVRVDLLYEPASYRTKKVIDMVGSLVFMMPMAVLIWMYGWYFMWRHLVTPKVSASDQLDLMMRKASILRWNVETVSFSPNGFNAYFLFKVLLLAFAGMVLLQAVAVFYRSYLEWREGPAAEGRYLDRDVSDAAASGH